MTAGRRPPRHSRPRTARQEKIRRRRVFVAVSVASLTLVTIASLFGLDVLP